MKTLPNYHSHTHFCDGKAAPEQYVEAALACQMPAYGFSSHCPFAGAAAWNMTMERLGEYVAAVRDLQARYQGKIELYLGLEMDYIPGVIAESSPHIAAVGLDYTIGSIHYTGTFTDGTHCEIDGPHTTFLRGMNELFGGDPRAIVQRYFELTKEMLWVSKPTVLGHLDKIKMQSENGGLFSEDADWYRNAIAEVLDVAKRQGVMIEVNTRGIYKKKVDTLYPSPWVLRQMREREIPVVVSSDAHLPSEIQLEFETARAGIQAAGYEEVYVLLEGVWQPMPLIPHNS